MRPDIIGFEKDDERQEFQLGKLLWLSTHPGHPDGDLKGYRRLIFHRKRMAKHHGGLRVRMIEEITKADYGLEYENLLVKEILALLPYAVKQEALRALAGADGRSIRRAGRLIRENLPDLVADLVESVHEVLPSRERIETKAIKDALTESKRRSSQPNKSSPATVLRAEASKLRLKAEKLNRLADAIEKTWQDA